MTILNFIGQMFALLTLSALMVATSFYIIDIFKQK